MATVSCTFYDFSKRENSTKRPSGTGHTYNCLLKDETSIENPVLELSISSPTFYNYAYISDFSRYYFVTDWAYDRGVWNAKLTVDVLATYKTSIGNATVYVLRSSADYDKDVKDTLIPTKSVINKTFTEGTLYQWASSLSQGTYIAYINNGKFDNHDAYGSLNYMTFTPANFTKLLKVLYPSSTDTWDDLKVKPPYMMAGMSILDPMDYITRVLWIPLTVGEGSYETAFGYYNASNSNEPVVPHGILSSFKRTQTVTLSIPRRNDQTRGSWADNEPFGKYYLHYAPFGIIALDSAMLTGAVSLNCTATLDLMNGNLRLTVSTIGDYGSFKDIVFEGTSNVGVEIPLDPTKTDKEILTQAVQGVLSAGAELIAGNYVGSMADLVSSIGTQNAMQNGRGHSINGLLAMDDTIVLYHEYYDFADSDVANKGRPLCQTRQISTLGGFMITNNGNISMPGTAGEKSAVRGYLERGFYYE